MADSVTVERLRLSLAELAAVAASVPGLELPAAFRPGPAAGGLEDVAGGLAARGLLLADGDRAVLDPQLTGLLELFAVATVRAELRVHERLPGADGPRRWITELAVAGVRGVRLTRGRVVSAHASADADGEGAAGAVAARGALDADVVEVAGFGLADAARELAGCIPVGRYSPDAASPRSEGQAVRSLWLTVHTSRVPFVDAWWDDGSGWSRAEPTRDGELRFSPVDRERLIADVALLLAGGAA